MTESVIDSPRFKRWFSGSKVVDEDGNPLICYHGTVSWKGQFKQWRPFTHFGTSRASTDAIMRRYDDIIGKNPITPYRSRIYPVFLSIKNPISMDDDEDLQHGPDQYQMELKTQLLIDNPSYKSDAIMRAGFNMLFFQHHKKKRITGEFPNRESIEEVIRQESRVTEFGFQYNFSNKVRLTVIRKVMRYYGYDGFVYENVVEHPGSISWVIIDDSQVWPIFKEGMDNQFFLTPTDRDVNPKYPLPVDSVFYKDISEPDVGYKNSHGPKKAKWPDAEIEMDEEGGSHDLYKSGDNIEVRHSDRGCDILFLLSGDQIVGKLSIGANNNRKGFIVDFKEKSGFKDRKIGEKLIDYADQFFKQLSLSMKATKSATDLWKQQKG